MNRYRTSRTTDKRLNRSFNTLCGLFLDIFNGQSVGTCHGTGDGTCKDRPARR